MYNVHVHVHVLVCYLKDYNWRSTYTVGVNKKLTKMWFGSVAVRCGYCQGSVEVRCMERGGSQEVRFSAVRFGSVRCGSVRCGAAALNQ